MLLPIGRPLVLLLAFFLDIFMGDPEYRWHPIRIIGRGIILCLSFLKKLRLDSRGAGVCLTLTMVSASILIYTFIHFILLSIKPLLCLLFDTFLCYSCLALKDLFDHVIPIVKALESNDLYGARKSAGMVVGRDVDSLDRSGVIRAAIETISENFVDGFLSPVFWFAAGCIAANVVNLEPVFIGTSLMLVFKTASTLDSMVGYKNQEFINIGWAGARLDDMMSFIPSRLSLLILFLGAWLNRLHPLDGMRVALRDRLKHDSPNSAHSESFVAGALNIRLGGPTRYPEGIKDKPWLGDEYCYPDIDHIMMAIRLLKASSYVTIIIAYLSLS